MLKNLRLIAGLLLAAFVTLVQAADPADAKAWPDKPIRNIVPFAAGGGVDLLARVVSEELARQLGQPVIVENRAGAGGVIGSQAVATSAADGYTMLTGNSATHAINAGLVKNLPYDPDKSFTPIIQAVSLNFALVVSPSLPVKTIAEFLALAKQSQNGLTFGSAGNGTVTQLGVEVLKSATGIKATHVAYKGAGPAVIDLLAGHVDFMFVDLPTILPHLAAGKVKALAIGSAKRSVLLPDVPTIAESGVPGFNVTSWQGFFFPAGTPPSIVARTHDAITKSLANAKVRDTLLKAGNEPAAGSSAEFSRFVQSEMNRWGSIMRAANIKAE